MFLSVVIPAYNEEKRIRPTLKEVYRYLAKQDYKSELIVVNDGSKDATENVVIKFDKERKKSPSVSFVPLGYKLNRGKGYAVKTGILAAKGEYMYLCDADGSTPIQELEKFLELKEEYDIVIGSRALAESDVETSFLKKFLGRMGNLMISVLLIRGIKDTQAGYKLFNKKAKVLFENQTIDRWGFDFEILYLAQKLDFKIKEIPVQWENREFSHVKPSDYFKTLVELIKIRLTKYNI